MNNSGLSGGWSGEIVLIRFLFSLSFFFFLILFLTSKILRRKTDDLSVCVLVGLLFCGRPMWDFFLLYFSINVEAWNL